jgi:isopentenyldiphosphate isomerase
VQQNDPTELLEVFDADGNASGRAKPRAAIHLDGDWHQAFHCWIVRGRAGSEEIVLQRRSLRKDTFAGCWDAAAAGHWRFGETAEQAAREIAEELGLDVSFGQLTFRGTEQATGQFPNGLVDREHHRVYVLQCDLPLDAYRPDPLEVSGLAAFDALALIDLVAGNLALLDASEAVSVSASGTVHPETITIQKADLVPYSAARLQRLLHYSGYG